MTEQCSNEVNNHTKFSFDIREISKNDALEMIRKYHYSNTLPRLNKYYIGFFLHDELVGVVTLGWGTRPLHTIKRIFTSLSTRDYLEIGRMCMTDDMPRNSESQMLSQLVKWIKLNLPELKILFTWADGMQGKVGYVYQASNFTYAGYSAGEMYMKDGIKIHPRQFSSVLKANKVSGVSKYARPTLEQMRQYSIHHYKGKQFRYLLFLCNKKEEAKLRAECKLDLHLDRPKEKDISWKVRDLDSGKWIESGKPGYITDFDSATKNIVELKKAEGY